MVEESHATACHYWRDIAAPIAAMPREGEISPTVQRLLRAFEAAAE
jgi:hypothetical protein